MRTLVKVGGVLLIVMGILHAIHVGRQHDVEYYLYIASLFLIGQGILTLIYLRR